MNEEILPANKAYKESYSNKLAKMKKEYEINNNAIIHEINSAIKDGLFEIKIPSYIFEASDMDLILKLKKYKVTHHQTLDNILRKFITEDWYVISWDEEE